MNQAETGKPLAGVRVLDFTNLPPGAACSVLLADLGAQIMRVEPPAQKGRASLVIGQVALSRGKRSLTLDLRHPRSAEVLKRLAGTIDVVIENARPGAMEQRGFGYTHARAVNPQLVWCAITGYGQDGPYAELAGHDLNFLAHSGLLAALGGGDPWHPGMSLALQAGALAAVVAIQAALIGRATKGEGSFIDVSLSEAATWFLNCGVNPLSPKPYLIPRTPDRRTYLCSDGRHLAIACAEPRTWTALCEELGVPDLTAQLHKWDDPADTENRLASIFATLPSAEWLDRLIRRGAAVSRVNHAEDLLDDPHISARGSIAAVSDVRVPAGPFRILGPNGYEQPFCETAPGTAGQDTNAVLGKAGFGDEEIAELERDGVI